MVVMRWVIVLGLLASCGRIGFDPLGDDGTGGGSGGSGDPGSGGDPGIDVDSGIGGDGGGSGNTMPTSHFVASGGTTGSGMVTQVNTPTGPLTGSNMVLVVSVHWTNATSSISTVQDSFGNGFSMPGSMARYNGSSHAIWIKRITAPTTIQVFFDQAAPNVSVKWTAYRDIAPTPQTLAFIGGSGTGTSAATAMITLSTNAVVVASSGSRATDASAGPGFALRGKNGGGVIEDLETGGGMVKATATLNSSNDWIIQLIALGTL